MAFLVKSQVNGVREVFTEILYVVLFEGYACSLVIFKEVDM